MNRHAILGTVVVGILLTTTPCYAHSLHPIFWWLGPVAPMMAIGSVVGCLPLLAISLLLHRFIPGRRFLGALWRAALIFVLSKVAETLPVFINPDVGLGPRSDSDAVFTTIVILMPVAAVVANSLLIGLLYWRERPKVLKVLWLAILLECMSLGGLYVTTTALWWAGIVW